MLAWLQFRPSSAYDSAHWTTNNGAGVWTSFGVGWTSFAVDCLPTLLFLEEVVAFTLFGTQPGRHVKPA